MIRTALGGARQPALLPGQEAAAAPTTPFGMADNAGAMEGPNEGTGEGGATEEMKAQAKVAKAMREMGQHGYGLPRERLDTMSLAELRGLMRQEERKVMGQEMALKQLAAQQAQQRIEQEAAIEQRIREGQRFNQGMAAKNFDLDWRKQMTAEGDAVMDRVRQSGLDLLREQDTRSQMSLRATQEQEILNNLKAGGPGTFSEDPVSGMRFYEKRNTVLPSGVNPEKAFGARQITGPGGESLGFGLPSRSGVQPMRDQTQLTAAQREQANARRRSDLLKSYNEELKALSNPLNWDGTTAAQRAQHRQQIQQEIDALRDEGTPAPAPASPERPAGKRITTQAQFDALPSGATYKGKDGRTYRKP